MYIKLTVTAGASKESFIKKNKDHFDVFVKEKAERNMANTKAIELVADYFKLPKNKVRIINGHTHKSKLLAVDLD